jgi:hypothetical protein
VSGEGVTKSLKTSEDSGNGLVAGLARASFLRKEPRRPRRARGLRRCADAPEPPGGARAALAVRHSRGSRGRCGLRKVERPLDMRTRLGADSLTMADAGVPGSTRLSLPEEQVELVRRARLTKPELSFLVSVWDDPDAPRLVADYYTNKRESAQVLAGGGLLLAVGGFFADEQTISTVHGAFTQGPEMAAIAVLSAATVAGIGGAIHYLRKSRAMVTRPLTALRIMGRR